MSRVLKKISPNYIFLLIYLIVIFLLLKSVVTAGINYQYDIDELFHVQLIWLYSRGYLPFKDVFSIYSPLFHYLLLPLFRIFGFNFDGIYRVRIIMSVLFLIRLLATFYIVKKLFNLKTAYIFMILFLLDPLSNFSSMQIRPDNLMVLLFTLGLLFLIINPSLRILLFVSTIFFSLAFLTSIKILPAILIVIFFVIFWKIKKKKEILIFLAGFFLPVIIFFGIFFYSGLHQEMLVQIFKDSSTIINSILNPGKLLFYFKPNNLYLFGASAKPLNWYYLISLPILSLFGGLIITYNYFRNLKHQAFDFNILLVLIFLVQLIFLFSVYSIFIQYFLPVSWLASIFAALFISSLISYPKLKFLNIASNVILLLTLILLIKVSVKNNLIRAKIDNTKTIESIKHIWQIIPKNEYVFPNYLFRPLAYPITYGLFLGDVPAQILNKYPRISVFLEKKRVKYLLLNDYTLNFLPTSEQKYIREKYKITSTIDNLWILK